MTLRAHCNRLGTLMAGVTLCSLLSGCDKSSTPTTPTAVTTPAQPDPTLPGSPTSVSVSGMVTAAGGGPVSGARVEIASGPNGGQAATTDAAGRYALTNLSPGAISLHITAAAYVTQTVDLTPAASQVTDITLTPVPFQAHGRVFDVDVQSALSGVTVSGDATSAAPSSAGGAFIVFAANDSSAPRNVLLNGPGIVTRRTTIEVPGPDFALSLIPSTFDLTSFDQMMRTPMLTRWTAAPPLLLQFRTLQFTDANASTATADADAMTDSSSLEWDLQTALQTLSGGAFSGFASVQRQTAAPGDTVNLLNSGGITVVRMAGLSAATGVLGFGRFQVGSDGTVVGGAVMLDRDFDNSSSPNLRSLRAHELGHALGYSHVTSRQSVMNADAATEPTPWDALACRIGFARTPGNRSPDNDPSAGAANIAGGSARWGKAIR